MSSPLGLRRVETASRPTCKRRILCILILTQLLAAPAGASDPDDRDGDDADDGAAAAVAQALDPAAAHSVGTVTAIATRTDRDVLDTAGNVTVIDRKAIEESGARNVPELLRREAGIYVANTTTSRAGYTVEPRGFNNGSGGGASVLLLIDGRRANEPESSIPAWELLALDNIERIEILRGPASALYGDNAVGGVIQIVTRGGEGPTRGTLTGRLGKHRTKEGSLQAGSSAGPLSISVFANHFQSDGYREQSDFEIDDFQGRADVALGDRASVSIQGGFSSDDRQPPGALTREEVDDDRRQVDPDVVGSTATVRNRFVDGRLRATPRDDTILTLHAYYTRRTDGTFDPGEGFVFTRDFETTAIGVNGNAQFDHEIVGRAVRTLVGVDVLREDRDGADDFSSLFFNSNFHRRGRKDTLGAYLQNEIQVTERLLVTTGVRHDRASYDLRDIDESFGGKSETQPTHELWSPRASALYRFTDTTSAYVSYSKGFRFPNLSDTAGVFGPSGRIDPQRSTSYEVGVKHTSRRVRTNLTLYHMDVKDEILLDSELGGGVGFPGVLTTNIDRVRHRGVESSWSVDLTSWFELHGSYTWDDTRIRKDQVTDLDGKRVPITPEHRGNLGFLMTLPQALEFGMDVLLVGRRWGVNDFDHRYDKLPSYRRWDLHAAWRPTFGEHLELGFAFDIENLMGRKYSEWAGRRTFEDAVGYFPSPTLEYIGTVSVTYRR